MYLNSKKRMVFYIIIAILFVVFDRFFKFLAINNLTEGGIDLLGKIFRFNFVGNYNIAFSLPVNGVFLNVLIILTIIWLMYYLMYTAEKGRLGEALALVFVVFGAASNLMDRLRHGFVIDYFDLEYFTVFNLADVMIVAGVAALAWIGLKFDKKEKTK